MKFVEHKLATGAMLTGYLRDETTEMPSYNTRPAVLILPGGGYRYCSAREADPVAVQFLQAEIKPYELEELDEEEDKSIPADPTVKNFSYTVVDGQV